MSNIYSLTKFLSTILLKQKSTIFFALITVFGLVISMALANTNIGIENKLIKDLILSMHNFLLHLILIFYTFNLLEKYQIGTISVIPLSLNINRGQYIVSLFTTLIIATLPIFAVFLSLDLAMLLYVKDIGLIDTLIQLVLYYLSAIILSFLTITLYFSVFKNSIKSIIIALILYMIGSGIDEVLYYVEHSQDFKGTNFELVINIIYHIIPNFSLFDFQSIVVNTQILDYMNVFKTILYFIVLSVFFYTITYFTFKSAKVIPNDS